MVKIYLKYVINISQDIDLMINVKPQQAINISQDIG